MILDPILIRMPNWLGDVVMATSAIEALHRTGRFRLHLLIRRPWTDLFRADPRVSEVIECDDSAAGLWSMAAAIRQKRFDSAADFTHSARSRILFKLAGVKNVWREENHQSTPPVHQSVRYLSIVRRLDASIGTVPWHPTIIPPLPRGGKGGSGEGGSGDPSRDEGESGVGGSSDILLFPAAAYGPAKTWSVERYRALLRSLTDRYWSVRLVGTESERAFLERIVDGLFPASCIPNPVSLTAGIGLESLMRLIAGARAVISCDSGASHLSAALGRPVIVLFFSTDPAATAPVGYAVRVIQAPVPCRPCFLRVCPIGYLCREAVTASQIIAHLDDIFDVPRAAVQKNTPKTP